ncbi:MAG: carbohydrate ABC transporter permease [Anaerolineaceae bacterium]|nr:carbohydrate ABC transporter permease [Anaerolineaceae bacterium]
MLLKIFNYILLMIMLLIALFPIYWMIITSVKPMDEIYSLYPTFWPKKFTLSGYSYLFQKTNFLSWLMNSSIVSIISSLITILFSIPAAYGLSRFRFKGSRTIGNLILVAYLLPQTLIFIPVYVMVNKIGLSSSIFGLLLIYPSTTIPYATWMLTSYFSSIERDFDDAALIDGCSRLQLLTHILIPLTAPGIVSTFIFSFTICWGEYLFALVILGGSTKTLPLGLSTMLFGDVARWNTIMGGAIIATIPVIIIYLLASKYIVSGLSLGGVKG